MIKRFVFALLSSALVTSVAHAGGIAPRERR